jgi:predicted DNA-binding protein (MmcQ/YjbR family)
MSMARTTKATDALLRKLREFGLAYPGAHTKSPWPGHLDLAVKDKTFAYLSLEGEPLSISCKLPRTGSAAVMLPFAKPTEYGLGKSGWVTAQFSEGETPPVDLLKAWIDESYRAQAPKKLIASLAAATTSGAPEKHSVPEKVRRKPRAHRAEPSRRSSTAKR